MDKKKIKATVKFIYQKTNGVCIRNSYTDTETGEEITSKSLGIYKSNGEPKDIWINPTDEIKESAMKYLKKEETYIFNMVEGHKFSSWESPEGSVQKTVTSDLKKPFYEREKVFLEVITAHNEEELQKQVNSFVLKKKVKSCPIEINNNVFYAYVWYFDEIENHQQYE